MKKIYTVMMLALAANFAKAQDIDEIRNLAILKQNVKAKEAVDKYLSVEKNAKKPEGWFYKAYITNELSKDTSKTLAQSNAMKKEAFETFKKYREMDPKASLLAEQNNSPLFDIYYGFSSDLAIKAYNAKDIAAANENFKDGLEVHDYMYANNIAGSNDYKFSAVDTVLTLYAAITANEIKHTDDAAKYYRKLADADIHGKDYIDVYQVLTGYYKEKKDQASFDEILAKGRKYYPENEPYWAAIEIENAVDGVEKPAVFAKYEELLTKHPGNYDMTYMYAAELFNYINSDDSKGVNLADYKKKLSDVLKQAIAAQSTFNANFLMATALYNNSFDISEEARKMKAVKPEEVKKKKAMEAESLKALDELIPYGEKAIALFPDLTKPSYSDKANYKRLLNMMKNVYDVKKDAAKAAEYDKMSKAAE